jgi:hypothetical protein
MGIHEGLKSAAARTISRSTGKMPPGFFPDMSLDEDKTP